MTIGSAESRTSLARQLAQAALAVDLSWFAPDVIAKAKACLLDFLADDVIAATPDDIRTRFRKAASDAIDATRALSLEQLIDRCESLPDGSVIPAHFRLESIGQRLRTAS